MGILRQTTGLRKFIGRYESNNDYNVVWGGISKEDRPPKNLTTMSIKEVLDWQDSIDHRYMSEAAGCYQIMEDTLRDIYTKAGFRSHSIFSAITQDHLAIQLMKRRGMDRYLRREITAETFCNNLAREWASLPMVTGPRTGRSYYAGDGLNKAHAPHDVFLATVKEMRDGLPPLSSPDTVEEIWKGKYNALRQDVAKLLEKHK